MRILIFLLTLLALPLQAEERLRIAVAANFKPTLEDISGQFQDNTGIPVSLSGASTGVLATQIEHGAPFHLFFSADRETPEGLPKRQGRGEPFCYARGSLVLVGADSPSALANPELNLAIANPAIAPYGQAAMEVLARPEYSAGAQRKLVRGHNVAQAYQFWHTGGAQLALVPRALVPESGTPIPTDWHAPVEQYAVVLQRNPSVDAFLEWVKSDAVRDLITQAGYEPCP